MSVSSRDVAATCAGVLVVLLGQLAAFGAAGGQGQRGGSNFREPDPRDFDDLMDVEERGG